jgi:uncharacterized protein (TIGR04551 family)
MRARALAIFLCTFALLSVLLARTARAQAADAGAPHAATTADAGAATTTAPTATAPTTTATTRPSLVPSLVPTAPIATSKPPPPPPAATQAPAASAASTAPEAAKPSDDLSNPNEVFSEDWWGRTRPVLEMHGYFRTRAELYHNFTLGRHDIPSQALWPQPIDNSYQDSSGTFHNLSLCGDSGGAPCKDQTESSANLRFRINPELHISDNLRVMAQVDAFDNMVLGSTPDSYALQPGGTSPSGYSPSTGNGIYQPGGYNTYAPIGSFTTTEGPPTSGINSFSNSVAFKRAWAEYMTPLGQLRFGRMPNQWGLGILANSGDVNTPGAPWIDSDYQSTVDRVMFVTGIKSIDLYFAGMWDWANSGPTNASPYDVYGGQPTNTCNTCNVNEWGLVVVHHTNPELQKVKLARGGLVINGGLFTILRSQYLDVTDPQNPLTVDQNTANDLTGQYRRRNAWALIPDLWLQILYKKFRLEAEGVAILGEIGAIPGGAYNQFQQTDVRMWGMAAQTEYRALEDKLHLQFDFGYASGDQWAQYPLGHRGLNPELNGNAISTFTFSPAYTIDLIFFRKILSRIEGAYYFRPEVDYDFIRNTNGQKFGGGAALIWSRASEFYQAPGHQPDLGIELDLQLYYQAKDGSLNDDPSKIGGFYTMLQYGVFFPLGGLGYTQSQQAVVPGIDGGWDLSAAQTVRWFVGVVY